MTERPYIMGVLKYLVTLCHYIPQSGKPLHNRYYVKVLYCNDKTLRYYFHGLHDEVMSNIQPTKTQPVLTDPDWLEYRVLTPMAACYVNLTFISLLTARRVENQK